ncbi:MAG: hypothetical protein RL499_1528 [Actinomycetota bacterium]|jgi:hypothetical protein
MLTRLRSEIPVRRLSRASLTVSAATIAAVALLAPAAVASAVPLTYPAVVDEGVTVNSPFPSYDIDVNCAEFVADYDADGVPFYADLVHVPGGSLTVTFDCNLDDFASNEITSAVPAGIVDVNFDGTATTVTLEPNSSFRAFFTSSAADFRVFYLPSALIDDPSGSQLYEVTSTYTGDTALFAEGDTGNLVDCIHGEGVQPYLAQDFTVLTTGTYTFRFSGYTPFESGLAGNGSTGEGEEGNPWGTASPWVDPVLVLYSSFDPTDTEAGFIECQDDSEAIREVVDAELDGHGAARDASNRYLDNYFSELVITITPGVYTLVTLPYDNPELSLGSASKPDALSPAYALADIDTTGSVSTTTQYWGPDRGLVLGAQLAATGASDSTAAGLAAAAGLLVLGGVGLVVARHRRTARR